MRDIVGKYNFRVRTHEPLIFTGVVKPVQQIADDIEPRQLLIVAAHNGPRRDRVVGVCQHRVARLAVVLPLLEGEVVERADLSLREWIALALSPRRRFCSALPISRLYLKD